MTISTKIFVILLCVCVASVSKAEELRPSEYTVQISAKVGNGSLFTFQKIIEAKSCRTLRPFYQSSNPNDLGDSKIFSEQFSMPRAPKLGGLPEGNIINESATGGSEHKCFIARDGNRCVVAAYVNYQRETVTAPPTPKVVKATRGQTYTECTISPIR